MEAYVCPTSYSPAFVQSLSFKFFFVSFHYLYKTLELILSSQIKKTNETCFIGSILLTELCLKMT